MSALLEHYRALARYNRWMNDRLYELAGRMRDEQRRRPLGAFFGSLHGTLNHLLLTDRVWISRFGACEAPVFNALSHLFNHQTHHRGQATTLFMQLGCDPGMTDLIALLRGDVR